MLHVAAKCVVSHSVVRRFGGGGCGKKENSDADDGCSKQRAVNDDLPCKVGDKGELLSR